MGDPCGVGPEIIVKAFDSPGFPGECSPLVVGDRLPLERAIRLLGSSAVVRPMTDQMLRPFRSGALTMHAGVIPLLAPAAQDGSSTTGLTPADIEFGKPSPAACEAAVSCDPNGGRTRFRRVGRCGLHLSHKQGTASQAWFSFSGAYGIHTGINTGRRRGNDACRTQAQGGACDDSRVPGRRPAACSQKSCSEKSSASRRSRWRATSQ